VRVLLVGDGGDGARLSADLEAMGVSVELRPDGPAPGDGADEIGQIAGDLREFESALGGEEPDAVLVSSASPAALAAVLVATKAGTPVARLDRGSEVANAGANARLIGQLADTALAPDPVAISEWARDGYPARR
jgi:UDP-N-acetylglucosamine 2-epimerase